MDKKDSKKTLIFLIISGILLTSLIGFNKIAETRLLQKDTTTDPIDLKVKILTDTKVVITWKTKDETLGTLIYSPYKDLCQVKTTSAFCLEKSEDIKSDQHKIMLDKLSKNKKYYFAIKTITGLYKKGDQYLYFKTKSPTFGIINNKSTKGIQNLSFNGFLDVGKGKKEPVKSAVLGVSTYNSNIERNRYNEFKKAIEDNNLNYDINNDNIVDTKDYPLYLEFITTQED